MFQSTGWRSFLTYDDTKDHHHVDRALLRRVLTYARVYRFLIILVLVMILLTSLLELIPPLLYKVLIDQILPKGDYAGLNYLALGMIGVPILTGLLGVVQRYFNAKVGESIIFDLRQQMYEHLQLQSIRFYTDMKSGEIISRFTNDVVGAQNAIVGTIPNIVTSVFVLVTTLVVMFSIQWHLAVLSIAVFPLFLIPTRRVGKVLRRIRRRSMQFNADMNSKIHETLGINGALLTKTFSREHQEAEAFRKINNQVREIGVRRALIGRWFFMGLGLAGAIGTALIYWVGGRLVLEQTITIGTIVAFSVYLSRLYGPISTLSNVHLEFTTSMVSFERVFAYLDLSAEIKDRPNARNLAHVRGKVTFENLSFRYKDDASWAIRHLSFNMNQGELVALVGPSGAGKTTVTYLFSRLYEPQEGRILIDNHDIRNIALKSLAQHIGVVTQETYLVHDTIKVNLLYARADASNKEIEEACRMAYLHDFIMTLPKGYDTVVGERGYRLSGGQKQRLAIARVILKDPAILILDEATSQLDVESEMLIRKAMKQVFQNRTNLIIAHRLSTVKAADKILVLNQGRIVQQGDHTTLLAGGGLYDELYKIQFEKN